MANVSNNVAKGGQNAAGSVSNKVARPAGARTVAKPSRPSQAGAMMGNQAGGGILRFYTDDAPGLKIGPVSILL